jgi:flagellar biosynthetic protein FliR
MPEAYLPLFSLVFLRMVGMVLTTSFGDAWWQAPRFRLAACVVLAIVITPACMLQGSETVSVSWCWAGVAEVMLGAVFGLGARAVFLGAELAGEVLASTSGISPPAADSGPDGLDAGLRRLVNLFCLNVFLLAGGHRFLLRCMLEAFRLIPPGSFQFTADTLDHVATVLSSSFALGIQAALPVLAAIVAAAMLGGIVGRLAAHGNALLAGSGLATMILFMAMYLGLGFMAYVFQAHASAWAQDGNALGNAHTTPAPAALDRGPPP